MAIDKKLIQRRIDGKLKLLRIYPKAWVYVFNNTLIRERFLRNVRQVEAGYNAIIDNWGATISTEEKELADKKFKELIEQAKNIIDFVESYAPKLNDVFDEMLNMRRAEKEQKVKDSTITKEVVDLFIPLDRDSEYLYQSLVYIDQYDNLLKRTAKAEEWIKKVIDFDNQIKNTKDDFISLIEKNVDLKYLQKYKTLQKEIIAKQKQK